MITPKFSFNIFQCMDILYMVEKKIAGNDNNMIAVALRNSIICGVPVQTIISNIKEMAEDNHNMIADLLGEKLLLTIQKFK